MRQASSRDRETRFPLFIRAGAQGMFQRAKGNGNLSPQHLFINDGHLYVAYLKH